MPIQGEQAAIDLGGWRLIGQGLIHLLGAGCLAGAPVLAGQEKPEGAVEAVALRVFFQRGQDFIGAAELSEYRAPQFVSLCTLGLRFEVVIQICQRLAQLPLGEVDLGQVVVQAPGQFGMLRLGFAKNAEGPLVPAGLDTDLDDSLIRAGGFFAQIRLVDGAEVQRRLRVVQNPNHFHETAWS